MQIRWKGPRGDQVVLKLGMDQWSEITVCLLAVHLQRLKGCPKALAI